MSGTIVGQYSLGEEQKYGAGGDGTTRPVVYNTLEEIKKFGEDCRQ